jgi:hydroxyacylglutathione hydrolase
MITIRHFVFNELEVNAFVLLDETGECIIVDPGCNTPEQCSMLSDFISAGSLKPVYVVNTHGHFDHIFGNAWVKDTYQCPLLIHEDDVHQLEYADKYGGIFGFSVGKTPMPDGLLQEGKDVCFGNSRLEIIHVPGHSPGSIALYSAKDNFLICGDILFRGSIGRTDLPGGDHDLLIQGICSKLLCLPKDTVVWPGHGPKTTIGHEYDTNPFFKQGGNPFL